MSSGRRAISFRAAPSSSWECRRAPGAKNTQTPGFAPTPATRPSRSASEALLDSGPRGGPLRPDPPAGPALAPAGLRPALPGGEGPPGLRPAAGHDDRAHVGRLED